MYLIDTNVFLEILLGQEKSEVAKRFLSSHVGDLAMSDFTLHSIGVILFRLKRPELFLEFINDTLPNIEVVTLPTLDYPRVVEFYEKYGLDFDDAYQCAVATTHGLTIVTMDEDFRKAPYSVKVVFL
ncbi:PIN domain-containing protein [Thermococcus sp. AM4]|uniref:type II toxin-antitoxin system VapC family toxin n=1 Tax=Thermococcus sp. (strain AM4) TaxID=246969 RepID=UPI000186F818|nr:PIN domain-containing protein [Thermococcus sp. AM4]EEB74950.1 putative PIN domain protein [Thermococcus sp. AM4]